MQHDHKARWACSLAAALHCWRRSGQPPRRHRRRHLRARLHLMQQPAWQAYLPRRSSSLGASASLCSPCSVLVPPAHASPHARHLNDPTHTCTYTEPCPHSPTRAPRAQSTEWIPRWLHAQDSQRWQTLQRPSTTSTLRAVMTPCAPAGRLMIAGRARRPLPMTARNRRKRRRHSHRRLGAGWRAVRCG